MIKRRLFAVGLVAAPFVKPAFAQAWQPSGPIKMVVAYPAGGPTDAIARIVAADVRSANRSSWHSLIRFSISPRAQ